MSLPPPRRLRVTVPGEPEGWEIALHAPHVFATEVAGAWPRFANRFAVNLGAGDGVSCNDPVHPLYAAGYAGLAIEGGRNEALAANLPSDDIRKLTGTFITPANVASLLADNGCPENPDFLKLDIDGYDGPVLRAILEAGFRPKVIQLEVQPEIPPPVDFAVLYDPDYRCVDERGRVTGFYGASLAHMCNVGRRFGYVPVQIDFVTAFTHDVTLVHDRFASFVHDRFGLSPCSDRERFLRHPPGYSHFREDDGIDASGWRRETDVHALARAVWGAAIQAGTHKHGRPMPFQLAVP